MKYWKITFFDEDFILLAKESIENDIFDGAVKIEEISKAEYERIHGK